MKEIFFYSPSEKGFYLKSINTDIPVDAVEIDKSLYQELLSGQSDGLLIVTGEDNLPTLSEVPELSYEDKVKKVELTRELEYSRRVRKFLEEAEIKKHLGDLQEYERLMDLAVQEREKIQTENPWPIRPIN
ncbi:hypothetical protein [Vibrio aestuarianus]|uniref:hypothetical protein n=1 Tax=Vibrio aestuarianus TaxID=28171 RepID=UPI00237D1CD5|nr:hypothetical protein [Vibrio aestuarianus]MDE1333321.1 hypothetical protein [Vibrio aestuarianus]